MSRLLQTRRGYDSEEDLTDSEGASVRSYTTGDKDETDSELEVTDSEYDSEEETDDCDEEADSEEEEAEAEEELHIEEAKLENVAIQPKGSDNPYKYLVQNKDIFMKKK